MFFANEYIKIISVYYMENKNHYTSKISIVISFNHFSRLFITIFHKFSYFTIIFHYNLPSKLNFKILYCLRQVSTDFAI